jgi:hypothetical protein
MTQFLIAVVSLMVPLVYLSWLNMWRRNVRLRRRLSRALATVRELEGDEEPLQAGGEASVVLAALPRHRDAA